MTGDESQVLSANFDPGTQSLLLAAYMICIWPQCLLLWLGVSVRKKEYYFSCMGYTTTLSLGHYYLAAQIEMTEDGKQVVTPWVSKAGKGKSTIDYVKLIGNFSPMHVLLLRTGVPHTQSSLGVHGSVKT